MELEISGMVIICPKCKVRTLLYEAANNVLVTPCKRCGTALWIVPFDDLHLVDAIQLGGETRKSSSHKPKRSLPCAE